ncbi:chromate efflux transporter [Lysobacter terrestris]|uniref:Chromate efflux transporter n=1 Tax=Agrilutibacter terrestris TaxID=2865112 RepID=A0A7H0G1N3_9GAMM|nr:chromate efflux transporter [Lysobacter terrestris]
MKAAPTGPASGAAPHPSFGQALRFWLLLGCISFGGPAGQIAIMHTELVDKRRWIDESAFLRALNFCMLLPGPEAMQLATWLGWRLHGLRGGIAAGALFVLPAAVLMALLSWAYLQWQSLPAMGGVVFGLQAAVLGIVAHAALRIGGRVLKTPFSLALAGIALFSVAVLKVPFPLLLLAAAVAGWWAWRRHPHWLPQAPAADATHVPLPAGSRWRALRIAAACALLWCLPILVVGGWLGRDSTAFALGSFFARTALLTLGGAYAVLPYVAQQAVEVQGWLAPAQMMTGLGLAETTPGPLILVLEFVGFAGGWQHPDLATPLASGLLGAAVAVWATFLPSFLFVLAAAPWIERIGRWPRANAVLAGITAAVVGVIAHLVLWFGWRLLSTQDWRAGVLALLLAALVHAGLARWRWPVAAIVPAAALVGVVAQAFVPIAA